MTAFDDLMAFQRETEALAQVAGRLSWDQETVMPRGAAPQRAEETAALETVLHARRVDPKVGEWLAMIDEAHLDDVGRAQLRHIRRSREPSRYRRLWHLASRASHRKRRVFGPQHGPPKTFRPLRPRCQRSLP